MKTKAKRQTMLRIRVTEDEERRLTAAAKAAHMPLGTWLRRLGLDAATIGEPQRLRAERDEVLTMLRRALAH